MKLEIGGGTKPRGDGWLSIDIIQTADIVHDLDMFPWPFADESVAQVYSSHCLEHLANPVTVLVELSRICSLGAPIEIRVPHPISDLAMICTHKHVFSPIAALNMEHHFPKEYWTGERRLKLERIGYEPSILLGEAKRDLRFLRGLSDETIMKWIPRTCHECVYFYTTILNEYL